MRTRAVSILIGVATVASLAAVGWPLSTAAVRPPSAPEAADTGTDQRILATYRRAMTVVLPRAAAADPAARPAILGEAFVAPASDRFLLDAAAADANGQRTYGARRPIRESVHQHGSHALVTGCVDASRFGVADAKTGRELTSGNPTEPTLVVLTRQPDTHWRVSAFITPSDRQTCHPHHAPLSTDPPPTPLTPPAPS